MGNVTITRENEKTVIHLSGRIDSSNAPQVEEEMMKAAKELDFERAMELRNILFEMKVNV